jgi:ABC-type Mn2+/Zn2+ transport system permease subunit
VIEGFLLALLIAAVLSLVGVWIVARDQIFFGAAVSQASMLGVALALWLGSSSAAAHLTWLEADRLPAVFAVAASIATAWLVARGSESKTESAEAITGWVFLLAASYPVLMLAHSPHGLEEVQRLMFSTLLSASRLDLALFAALGLATAAIALRFQSPLLLFAMDTEMATAVGMRRAVWNGGTALWLGLAVGLSIRASGMLYTFGCLVLPALLAKNLCREVRPMLVVAPSLAATAALAGLVIAHSWDLPPAHATIGLLCLLLPGAWIFRAARVRRLDLPAQPSDAAV